jgi:transcriptional regulator of nitric oxide reductase
VVIVAFWVLVLVTSASEIVLVSVSLTKVVDVTSGAEYKVLAVNLAVKVVVAYAVTSGRLLEEVLEEEARTDEVRDSVGLTVDDLMLDDTEVQVWTEPIPTVKGCVSTWSKSMKLVEAKKLPNWY